MHKGMLTDDRRVARYGTLLLAGLALLIGLILGSLLGVGHHWQNVQPALSSPRSARPVDTSQLPVQRGGVEAHAMSPRAAAQYRAFYGQQMASEAALERWALPTASTSKISPAHSAFYAQQMASEAALERWAGRGRTVEQTEPLRLVPQLRGRVPFE
jgi:hypothetical protein